MIYIGSDHGGFHLKEKIKKKLNTMKIEFEDLSGKFDDKDDYPDISERVARKVTEHKTKGIIICATGTGAAIAANKVKGVRSAVLDTKDRVYLARLHEDLNVLCLRGLEFTKPIIETTKSGGYKNLLDVPSKAIKVDHAIGLIKVFLETAFEGGRHERRIKKIEDIEKKYSS